MADRLSVRSVAVVGVYGDDPPKQQREPKDVEAWEVTPGGSDLLDLMPEALRVLAERLGRSRATTIWRLIREGVQGSAPELLTYNWLKRRGLHFDYQSPQMGGRRQAGGAVVDFLIYGLAGRGLYAWRVMGEYWHAAPEVQRKDVLQKQRFLGTRVYGQEVVAVVDLWEGDIYDRAPEVFKLAEAGVGLRG